MTTNLTYSTGALVGVVRNVEKTVAHFRDRYYTRFQFEEGEKIIFDTVNGKPRVAPYVHPKMPGRVMDFEPFTTSMFQPAYVKPKTELNPEKWLKRLPGEVLLGSLSNQQRRDLTVAMVFESHEEMLTVREEAQCAEFLRTGKVTVEGDGYGVVTVDFGRDPSLSIVLAGAARWGQAGVKPLTTIKDAARTARAKSGGWVLTEVTMDPESWEVLLASLTEQELEMLFNSLRASDSRAELGPRAAEKLQYQGKIGDFHFWTYQDSYVDVDGTEKEILPEGSVVLANATGLLGTRAYGAIRDPRAGFQALRNFPKVWIEEDPAVEWAMSQSAPLMYPYRPNASVGMRVL